MFSRAAPAAVAIALCTVAIPAGADEAAWDALARPGALAIMRHANAPGVGDPDNFALGDCSTQRNLDDRGRAQATAIGEAFRARNVDVGRVYTSQWCRARETAELLGLGTVDVLAALNSFFEDRNQRAPQTEALRESLAAIPDEERAVLVTHQVNITALTGQSTRSGEIVVVDVGDDGTPTVLGSIAIPVP